MSLSKSALLTENLDFESVKDTFKEGSSDGATRFWTKGQQRLDSLGWGNVPLGTRTREDGLLCSS